VIDPQLHATAGLRPAQRLRFRYGVKVLSCYRRLFLNAGADSASQGRQGPAERRRKRLRNTMQRLRSPHVAALAGALAVTLTGGCSGGSVSVTGPAQHFSQVPYFANAPLGSTAIAHVVVIVQENRSFDNLFHGFPGADSATFGHSHHGDVPLVPVDLASSSDIQHLHVTFQEEFDGGKMDGFDVAGVISPPEHPAPRGNDYPYGYVSASQIGPYWQLASQYVLADRAFESNAGPSFPAHQYLIAGQSDHVPDGPDAVPWGCDSPPGATEAQLDSAGGLVPGPFPCFSYATLGNELDAKGLDWRYYTPALGQAGGIFNAFDAIRNIRYGPDWATKVLSPETRVLDDIAAGYLAPVTWVVPNAPNSDHSGTRSTTGPQWVASVVNAVGASRFWSSTAIFILWDDWGGWFDHVAPPQYDVMGPGFRIPLIVVSPWAKHGYVSHVQHEVTSIAKFIEDDFDLPSLGTADARADNLIDCFDFSQTPGPFRPVSEAMRGGGFSRQPPAPPDTE
jgi:phospholipase C